MRVAVLGCGSIGQRHLRNLVALGCRDVVAFEPDEARRAEVARELHVTAVAALADVWTTSPDVALVTAPSFLHVPLALEAARHGCDLFIEKPLSHTMTDVAALEHEARRRDLVTLVGCNMRFHPGPATVKRLIDDRAIGTLLSARLQTGSYLPEWRPGTDYRVGYSASAAQGGGAILDCIHEIDLALWYLGRGRLAAAVTRPASSIGLDVEGLAELLLEHETGAVSSVHLNFLQRDYRRGCQVVGSDGTIYWDFAMPQVRVVRGDAEELFPLPADWSINQMYVDEMTHFLECVAARRPTTAPLADGAAALELALAARASQPLPGQVPA